jgi:hypothetical protein
MSALEDAEIIPIVPKKTNKNPMLVKYTKALYRFSAMMSREM